jgi:photosystem II stability/assembly factor-like uncharacterized protein
MNIKLGNFFAVLCVVLLCLCGSVNPVEAQTGLAITSVDPQTVYNDLDTTITVTGSEFTDVIRVTLNETDLTDVVIVDSETLTAVIPWGMEPGTYPLSVYTVSDQADLPAAITIELGIGEWITKGPYGGDVNQILQDPVNTDRIYTVVAGVGVFRSVDHGESWDFIFSTATGYDATLAMDAVNPNLLYIAKTHEGLYRSTDGGDSWQAIPFPGIPQINIARAFPDPTQANTVFAGLIFSEYDYDAGIDFGIYKSTNAGTTWTHVSDDIPNDKVITSIAYGTAAMYASTDDGLIYRGTDGGTTWVEMAINWADDPVENISKIKVQPVTNDLFVINYYSGTLNRCEEAEDSGVFSLNCGWVLVGDETIFGNADPTSDVQFNPDNHEDILIAYSKPARSMDNGASWEIYSDLSAPFQPKAVMFDLSDPDSDTIFSSNAQGLFRNDTADVYATSEWVKKVEGLTGIMPTYMAVSASEPLSIYANPNGAGMFHSSDGGVNWEQLPNFVEEGSQYASSSPIAVDSVNDDYVVIPTTDNTVWVSLDGGMTWDKAEQKIVINQELYPGYTFNFRFLEPIPGSPHEYLAGGYLMDPLEEDAGKAPAGAIYRLALDGMIATWTELLVEPDLGRIQAVVFDPNDPANIYCASFTKNLEGDPLHAAMVYSEDGGAHWDISIASGEGLDGFTEINAIAMSPSTGIILVDGGADVLSIDPETKVWAQYGVISLNRNAINQLLVVPALGATPETLYAAALDGLFQSVNGGQTWTYVSPKFIGVNVTVIKYAPLSETQGIVYTGIVGGLVEATGGGRSSEGLVDGGVYHLTRSYTEGYLTYLPLMVK